MSDKANQPELISLPVDSIEPNPFNPNRMKKRQFEQYKAEVQRLGYLPKPTIVRPLGDGKYQIVDGEHGYRAGKKLGMQTILCEIREIDDFDAKRECYFRNRGGTDNPVALGRMFQLMMKERKLSQRGLAKELRMSPGAVRNKIDYAKAAEVRTRCAPQTADDDIAALTQDQVREYKSLPETVRDRWLDSGGALDAFEAIDDWPACRVPYEIHRHKLGEFLDTRSNYAFKTSVNRFADLCVWCESHKVADIVRYLSPVARLSQPADVLDCLPLEQEGGTCRILIRPEDWEKSLTDANKRATERDGLLPLVQSGVNVLLRKAGHDLANVLGPDVAEALQIVEGGPDFIKDADFLSLEEKRFLVEVSLDADEESLDAAKKQTVEVIRTEREKSACGNSRKRGGKTRGVAIDQIFQACLSGLLEKQQKTQFDELFADEDRLFEIVVDRLGQATAVQHGMVHNRPAADVLSERLDAIAWPEFFILAAAVLGIPIEVAAAHWLQTVDGGARSSTAKQTK